MAQPGNLFANFAGFGNINPATGQSQGAAFNPFANFSIQPGAYTQGVNQAFGFPQGGANTGAMGATTPWGPQNFAPTGVNTNFGQYANSAVGGLQGVASSLGGLGQSYVNTLQEQLQPALDQRRKAFESQLYGRGIEGSAAGRALARAQAEGQEAAQQGALLQGLQFQRGIAGDLARLQGQQYGIQSDAAQRALSGQFQADAAQRANRGQYLGALGQGLQHSLAERRFGADTALRAQAEQRALTGLSGQLQQGHRGLNLQAQSNAERSRAARAAEQAAANRLAFQQNQFRWQHDLERANLALRGEQDRRAAELHESHLAYLPRQRALQEYALLNRRQPYTAQKRPSSGVGALTGLLTGFGQGPWG